MSSRSITVEVILAAYNQADYMRLVLEAYANQSDKDFTIAVADDGSGPEVKAVIDEYIRKGMVIRHHWHEDNGFRKSKIVNEAFAASTADYLILSDNDCMPQKDFIADHKRRAGRGYFVVGRRVNLNSTFSERFVSEKYGVSRINSRLWLIIGSICGHLRYAEVGLHIPWWLCVVLSKNEAHLLGANVGVWREDILAVNGYDSDFVGYGMEDTDLEWRLRALGLLSRTIKGRAGLIHLYHPERSKTIKNVEIMKQRQGAGIIRAKNGITTEKP